MTGLLLLSLAWCIVAFSGACRSGYLWNEFRKDRIAITPLGNGKLIVANGDVEHSFMGIFIYLSLLVPGLLSLLYVFELITTQMRVTLAPIAAVAALLLLFIRQERDIVWRRRHWTAAERYVGAREDIRIDRIDMNTEDTNRMMRQATGEREEDRPLEKADQGQTLPHREATERRLDAQDTRMDAQDERMDAQDEKTEERS